MPHDATHASFFSGVGGLDLGLERAGWRTVSFSEIDPYASAVLAERWPGVPNLGDIVALAGAVRGGLRGPVGDGGAGRPTDAGSQPDERPSDDGVDWQHATLWSGGFPCQDLSVAGKRAGFGIQQHGREPEHGLRAAESIAEGGQRAGDSISASGAIGRGVTDGGTRSGLAFAFLDLVERHRPPAILLENVPGLLSSHRGRDFGALLDRLAQLGYGWAYRILDARHFGVPQRRRRVFIVALDAERGFGADSAAAVLSVGSRCGRHPATGHATGEGAAEPARPGVDIARAVTGTSGKRHDDDTDTLVPVGALGGMGDRHSYRLGDRALAGFIQPEQRPPPDPGGVRAPDGLAGRVDDLDQFPTLRGFGHGWQGQHNSDLGKVAPITGTVGPDDPLLPLGLDSHRYRCCGNGVVSSVAEWVGLRLREAVA